MASNGAAADPPATARPHWPEYFMEGALLAGFMVAACGLTTLLEHPGSVVHQALPDPFRRRVLMGLAMGVTAIGLIHSPWGQQSGAHMNPALTLAYFRLGKIARGDAAGYVLGQFVGAIGGVQLVYAALGRSVADPTVRFAVTVPGGAGTAAAFAAEFGISFVLMAVVLMTSNSRRFASYTPMFCGALIACCITFEAPVSGMSMNPARTVASALGAGEWTALWIYLVAPPAAMLAAAEAYVRLAGWRRVLCGKLNHRTARRCIFVCRAPRNVGAAARIRGVP